MIGLTIRISIYFSLFTFVSIKKSLSTLSIFNLNCFIPKSSPNNKILFFLSLLLYFCSGLNEGLIRDNCIFENPFSSISYKVKYFIII